MSGVKLIHAALIFACSAAACGAHADERPDAQIIAFPTDRVAAPTADHSATPICEKLLINGAMSDLATDRFARLLHAWYHDKYSRHYVRQINQLVSQLEALDSTHSVWKELWFPILANEVDQNRIRLQRGFSQKQIFRAELSVLRGIAQMPTTATLYEFFKMSSDDFFRWEPTTRTLARAQPEWRAAWLGAEVAAMTALQNSNDRFQILSWLRSSATTVEFSQHRAHVAGLAAHAKSKTIRERARLWLQQVATVIEQINNAGGEPDDASL